MPPADTKDRANLNNMSHFGECSDCCLRTISSKKFKEFHVLSRNSTIRKDTKSELLKVVAVFPAPRRSEFPGDQSISILFNLPFVAHQINIYCQWCVLQGKTVPKQGQPYLLQHPRVKKNIFFYSMKRKVSRGSITTVFLDIYYLLVQQFDFMCFDTPSPLLRCLAVCLGKKVQTDGQHSSWRYRKYPRTNRHPVQTLPGKPELEALEQNLIRRQNTLSIKNLCRSLLPRNVLLSGVIIIITSMLIQVHATARLISGLVQIAKQTPAGIQSDNTEIDLQQGENLIPKPLVTRTTQEQYSLTSETSWFEPHPPSYIYSEKTHETRVVSGPIFESFCPSAEWLDLKLKIPQIHRLNFNEKSIERHGWTLTVWRQRTHSGASHALLLQKRIRKELRYNRRNKKTNSLARTPRAKWAGRQKSLGTRSHPKVLVVPYWD